MHCIILFSLFFFSPLIASASLLRYTGGAESGAEFGGNVLPGTYGTNYIYPSNFSIQHLNSKGMNLFRIPFLWERMQPILSTPLDSQQLSYLKGTVAYVTGTAKNAYALLDPHNYARYRGNLIGSPKVTYAQFQDFWARLAAEFKDNPKVIFGLMNEPNTMPTEQWLQGANAGIAGIRSSGATQLITVPGNGWTGASAWSKGGYGTPNSIVMLNTKDPLNNFVFEVHQYLDSDFSGSHPTCQSTTIGVETLMNFTGWCKEHGFKGFLGEFAGGDNTVCQTAVQNMLNYMEQNSDQWAGFSWWAAGPWWGDYMFSIEPYSNGTDRPQMAWLEPHLQPTKIYMKNPLSVTLD